MDRTQEIAKYIETAMVDGGFRLVARNHQILAFDLLNPDNPPVKIYTHGKTFKGLRVSGKPMR